MCNDAYAERHYGYPLSVIAEDLAIPDRMDWSVPPCNLPLEWYVSLYLVWAGLASQHKGWFSIKRQGAQTTEQPLPHLGRCVP